MALSMSSTAFQHGDSIDRKYTCEGQDISPPLTWNEPPEGTLSLALIMDDPDAPGGVFTHRSSLISYPTTASCRKLSLPKPSSVITPYRARTISGKQVTATHVLHLAVPTGIASLFTHWTKPWT